MICFFAQIETVPSELIKNVALIIMATLACLYYARETFSRRRSENTITPQPLEVQAAAEYALKSELQQLRQDREKDRRDSEESRRRIYDQMEKVRLELSDKIDEMPSNLIAILKNTGAIE